VVSWAAELLEGGRRPRASAACTATAGKLQNPARTVDICVGKSLRVTCKDLGKLHAREGGRGLTIGGVFRDEVEERSPATGGRRRADSPCVSRVGGNRGWEEHLEVVEQLPAAFLGRG